MRGTKERICALDNRLRIISAIPAGGDLSGSKADFAIMHERLAYAGKEKVIQAWIVIEKSTIKGFLCKACYFAKADTIITYKLLRGWKRQVDASSGGIPIATIAFDNAKSRPNASNDGEGYLSLYKASSDALAVLYVDSSLKEKIVRSEKMAPRAWKGYLVGIEVVRARDIRFVNRARLSAIVDNPSIEFKACLEEEERDQSKGRLRTPEGDPSHLPLPDPTPNKGETARRPITKKLTFCRRHLRAFLASFNPLVCVDRITAPKALLIRRDLGHGAYKTLEEIRPSQFSCIDSNAPLKISPVKARSINEKAAILDALYEVKHLAHEDAVALEIYDSLRLERSRDRDRTRPDITYSVKKLLEANCHLIHAYLVALKHLLRYLRGTYSLRITLGGYPRLYGRIRNLPSGRPYCVEIKALDDSYD
ncbi:hypothetical protein L249_4862 [Ophiocordyceps polyrhachis-furcata BCC 54312]|uniref:Uncharacterized protein n=1 Tax=Ophiocordyceps polyrhachis-furcata BCC 54312 TaxID=1330021 RepID=A0A367L2F3_9HYPO|nr:hypothetical protein L249_4862 [Ophiocordyceps polyrhachis-furcata BCC 54312]